MPFVSILLLILAGVLSVALTEVVAVGLMVNLPGGIDISGNFFLFCVLPASIVAGVVVGLLFGRFMRRESFAIGLVYVVTYVGGQFALMTGLLNPIEDRLSYFLITLPIALLVLLWRRAGREEPTAV